MRTLVISAVLALAVPALALATAQSMSPVVSAKLKGASEAGVKGDPNGSGLVVVHLSTAKGTACWQFSAVKNIAPAGNLASQRCCRIAARNALSSPMWLPCRALPTISACRSAR